MKDYSEQIISILISDLKQDYLKSSEIEKASGPSGISKAAEAINSLIQSEVHGLELHIVDLTEQLFESERLMLEAKKTSFSPFTNKKPGYGAIRVRRSRTIKTDEENK
jgi:hypothetical protein